MYSNLDLLNYFNSQTMYDFFKDQSGLIGGVISAVISAWILIRVTKQQKEFSIRQQNESQLFARKQQFETSFFNLLGNLETLVKNTEGYIYSKPDVNDNLVYSHSAFGMGESPSAPKGREFFREANNTLQSFIDVYMQEAFEKNPNYLAGPEGMNQLREVVAMAYNDFFDKNVSQLAHYYRYLFNLIKFVLKEKSIEDKSYYINFIQAQLSSDELSLLFFNGLGKHGKKFYDIIEDYNFLENLDPGKIERKEVFDVFYQFYPKSKFRFIELKKKDSPDLIP